MLVTCQKYELEKVLHYGLTNVMNFFLYQEHHLHVHRPKAVIVGDHGNIVVVKKKRKKSNGSLHPEIQQQQLVR